MLDGKKTYIIAGVAIAYLIACKALKWDPDQTVMGILGALGLSFLRSGLNKQPEKGPE